MALSTPPNYTVSADGSYVLTKLNGDPVRYKKYRYEPLSTKRSIRLLRPNFDLENPSHRTEGRFNHFVIEEHSLDDPDLKYIAISYVWGYARVKVPLTFGSEADGSVLLITATAWKIIQKLSAGIPLWIDQICIDQGNEKENAAQIDLMGEIYSGPGRYVTAVWLGDADERTEVAFDFVETLAKVLPIEKEIPVNADDAFHLPHDLVTKTIQETYPEYSPPASSDPGWASLAMILARTWFSRMWTFQEVVLSNNDAVSVISASWNMMCKTTLRKLIRASVLLGDYNTPGYNDATSVGRTSLRTIIMAQHSLRTQQPVPLHWLLDITGDRNCERPRDKIYALLGIQSRDSTGLKIKVDLKKSADEIYAETTREIIVSESSLLISLSASGRQGGTVTGLPSWVPDFSGKIFAPCIEALNPNRTLFSASGGRKLDNTVTSGTFWKQLRVQGRVVDAVEKVIQSDMPIKGSGDDIYSYLRDSLPTLLQESIKPSDNDHTVQTKMLRLSRTLILDGYGTRISGFRRFSFISRTAVEHTSLSAPPGAGANDEDIAMLRFMFSTNSPEPENLSEEQRRQWKLDFVKQAASCKGRRFAILENLGVGLFPYAVAETDIVTILHGSSLPVVLRAIGRDQFQLIGPCYVDGIMRGEVADWSRDPARPFVLV